MSQNPIHGLDNHDPTDAAVQSALKPLDRVARASEGKWGIYRLEALVPPDLGAKFGSAQAKLNAAISANDPTAVAAKAAALIRGYQALDAAATQAGHASLPPHAWAYTHHGRHYTVVLEPTDLHHCAAASPNPESVVSIGELLFVWEASKANSVVSAAKAAFPGAAAAKTKALSFPGLKPASFTKAVPRDPLPDDEIPF